MRQFELENKTTRDAFGAAVLELAKEDPTVIAHWSSSARSSHIHI